MKPETLAILLDADDALYLEAPFGFDWHREMARVKGLKPSLEKLLNHELVLDEWVQDASFFAELHWLEPDNAPNEYFYVIQIRFSAFGNLFTIWENHETRRISPNLIEQVIQLVGQQGFRYVDFDELDEPYTGKNGLFKKAGHETVWYVRFFDYL